MCLVLFVDIDVWCKIFGEKGVWCKKVSGVKVDGCERCLVQKMFGVKKIWSKRCLV